MSSEESPILLGVESGVATITFNRPAVLNALNNDLAEGLFTTLTRLESDRAVRVVVFRGAGDAFMAGGDIGYFHRKLAEHAADKNAFKPVIRAMVERAQ